MKPTNNEEIEISLLNCFAYAFKNWFKIAVWSIIFALLLLGYHVYSVKSGENEEFQIEHSAWELSLNQQNSKLANLLVQEKLQSDVVYNSPLMKINSENYTKINSVFKVEVEGNKYVLDEQNKLVSLSEEKAENLVNYFEVFNLKDVLISDFSNNELKQLVSFSSNAEIVSISVICSDKVQGEKWIDSLNKALLSFDSDVQLQNITFDNSSYSDVAEIQEEIENEFYELEVSIDNLKKEIKKFEKEEPSSFHPVKFGGIGFAIGFIISCCIYILGPVLSGQIACSSDMEKNLGLVCLATMRISRKRPVVSGILREKVMKNQDEENKYLEESMKLEVKPDEHILFVSTQTIPVQDRISSAVAKFGANASFIENAEKNKDMFAACEKADSIVIVEKMLSATEFHVREIEKLVNRSNKTIEKAICLL